MTRKNLKFNVLSIDAWADDHENSWTWNNWHKIATYLESERGPLDEDAAAVYFYDEIVEVENWEKFEALFYVHDDQYNLVLTLKENDKPIFAIEYGHNEDE